MNESQPSHQEKLHAIPVRQLIDLYRQQPEQHTESEWRHLIAESLKNAAQTIQQKNDWSINNQFSPELEHERRRPISARELQGRSLEILLNPNQEKLTDQLNTWYPPKKK